MIMTSVEAHVAPERHEQMKQAFGEKTLNPPPALKQVLLVQSSSDPTLWRSVGFWPNRVAFEGYRNSGEVSAAFRIFRSVGTEPTVHVFEVVDQQEWR